MYTSGLDSVKITRTMLEWNTAIYLGGLVILMCLSFSYFPSLAYLIEVFCTVVVKN